MGGGVYTHCPRCGFDHSEGMYCCLEGGASLQRFSYGWDAVVVDDGEKL
jgi:hypothetical protein